MRHLGTFTVVILEQSLHLGVTVGWEKIRHKHINAFQGDLLEVNDYVEGRCYYKTINPPRFVFCLY